MFKVGDKYRNKTRGDVQTVIDIDSDGDPQLSERGWHWKTTIAEQFEKVEEQFKVGDRVRILAGHMLPGDTLSYQEYMGKLVGREFSITSVSKHNGMPLYRMENAWSWRGEWLEKVEEPRTATEVWMGVDFAARDSWTQKWYRTQDELRGLGFDKIIIDEVVKAYARPSKGIIMSAVDKVRKLALKTTNNDEYQLREAGLHDEDGELTAEGQELAWVYLDELVKEKLVQAAREINTEKEKK